MSEPVLDFGVVSREIRGLVARRRELMLFLGSLFAGMGIYLQNILEGKLPKSLARLEANAFLTYSLALTIPAVVVALRLAKLHTGMVINGVFYSKLLSVELRPNLDPKRAGKLNPAGVSTQFFILTSTVSAFGATLLTLAFGRPLGQAVGAGAALIGLLALCFLRFHVQARRFALLHIQSARLEKVDREDLEDHLAESLRDVNHDMLNIISFVGLIVFSVFQALSGMGGINPKETEFSKAMIETQGPLVLTLLLAMVCCLCTVVYLRLLHALGGLSIELDPTDRPFRIFKLTDSFLGYCILAFFLAVATHLLAFPFLDGVRDVNGILWSIDGLILCMALAIYGLVMAVSARQAARGKSPVTPVTDSKTGTS